jgi:DNA-binding NtrC family response regulator
VVDNDLLTLETVVTLLRVFSHAEIWPFRSAREALETFMITPNDFQLVITQFEMPKLNGVDFRKHLHALAPDLKVFLITVDGRFSEQAALQNGFCGVLRKPFTLGGLKLAIEHAQSQPVVRNAVCAAI